MQYGEPFPLDEIKDGDRVYIVDFSPPDEETFDRLITWAGEVIWIDHHKTALEKFDERRFNSLVGNRLLGRSACYLCWKYFFVSRAIPRIVAIIDDWDLHLGEFKETHPVATALRIHLTDPAVDPAASVWDSLLWRQQNPRLSVRAYVRQLYSEGMILLAFIKEMARELINTGGYIIEFEGHRVLALNYGTMASQIADYYLYTKTPRGPEDANIAALFRYLGDRWIVEMRSNGLDDGKIHLGNLCKKYGGGGHEKAAGFPCKELPAELMKPITEE